MLGNTEYGKFLAQDFPVYAGRTKPGDVVRFGAVRYSGSWDLNPAIQNSVLTNLKDNTNIDVDFTPHSVTLDRKSTRLNSSHLVISYAVFCLKKKKKPRAAAGQTEAMSHYMKCTMLRS